MKWVVEEIGSGKMLQRQKKGPWSLEERGRKMCMGKWVGVDVGVPQTESGTRSSVLRTFIWRSQRRIPIQYSLTFQVCPFRVMVFTVDHHRSRGPLFKAVGPDVSRSIACLVLLLFCAWSWNTTEAEINLMWVRTSLFWRLNVMGYCPAPCC